MDENQDIKDIEATCRKWEVIEKQMLQEIDKKSNEAKTANLKSEKFIKASLAANEANQALLDTCHRHYFITYTPQVSCAACGGLIYNYSDAHSYAVGYHDAGGNALQDVGIIIDHSEHEHLSELEYYMKYKDNKFYEAGFNAFKNLQVL